MDRFQYGYNSPPSNASHRPPNKNGVLKDRATYDSQEKLAEA